MYLFKMNECLQNGLGKSRSGVVVSSVSQSRRGVGSSIGSVSVCERSMVSIRQSGGGESGSGILSDGSMSGEQRSVSG